MRAEILIYLYEWALCFCLFQTDIRNSTDDWTFKSPVHPISKLILIESKITYLTYALVLPGLVFINLNCLPSPDHCGAEVAFVCAYNTKRIIF